MCHDSVFFIFILFSQRPPHLDWRAAAGNKKSETGNKTEQNVKQHKMQNIIEYNTN
jgi:hypothetical protein